MARKHYFIEADALLDSDVCSLKMRKAVEALARKHDVVLISNDEFKVMREKFPFLPMAHVMMFSQAGTFVASVWRQLWKRRLNRVHKAIISEHIRVLKSIADTDPVDENKIVDDRGGLISYSVLGHTAPKQQRDEYDPTGEKRRKLLELFPLTSTACRVELRGGDSLDYTAVMWSKCDNMQRLISIFKWDIDSVEYLGTNCAEGSGHDVLQYLGSNRCWLSTSVHYSLEYINSLL